MGNRIKVSQNSRRNFLRGMGYGMGGLMLSAPLFSFASSSAGGAGRQTSKMGVALVGLGQYSTNQLAPALQETKNCYLAGIVTGTPSKVDEWRSKYHIPEENVYDYENFDEIANNESIDIVYVVLPNSMHAEFAIRAAKAKKHVICEKPMATTIEDAERMLKACADNGVKLAIGYRLHYEPFHQRVMELGQQEIYGKVTSIKALDSGNLTSGSVDAWRLRKDLAGGGPLMDLGIYCVQGACYTMGKTPLAVRANFGEVTNPTYFYEVEQSISWQMEFEDGVVADCNSSYAKHENELSGKAERGWWKVSPAYSYEGKKGETHEGKMEFPNVYEQVRQMDSQALSFRNNQEPITSGEMGLRDMKILMAIYESAHAGGKRVLIP